METRYPPILTPRNPIKMLNWKLQDIHRGPGADLCRPWVCGPSLRINMCFDHLDLEGLVFLVLSFLALTLLQSPLLQGFLSPEGRDLKETFHLGLSVLRSLQSLHVWLWVSVFVIICCRRKLFWWWLSKALVYEYSRMSLSHFIVNSSICLYAISGVSGLRFLVTQTVSTMYFILWCGPQSKSGIGYWLWSLP